jgi:magnesium chelatase subunit D
MNQGYPFSAIVGQELLKKALLLSAVDPTIGLLIRGDKGTAKSTAARGLAGLLPDIRSRQGCQFNCEPERPLSVCETCNEGDSWHLLPVPFVNLPLSATEDRVLGSLDFEKALKEGRQKFQPGLLASAHRGILYIDEVNLLADHLVDVLLDVAAMGINTVQREGLSVSHPARVTLIGTMNPEEGDLRPQLLDRFGMMVDVSAPTDPVERAAVVRSRLNFEANPAAFRELWQVEQRQLQVLVVQAINALPAITIDDQLIALISTICCKFNIVSLRADIVMAKVARALAALSLRRRPDSDDVKLATLLVLAHRKRINPLDKVGLDQELLDETLEQNRNSLSALSQSNQGHQEQEEKQELPKQDQPNDQSDINGDNDDSQPEPQESQSQEPEQEQDSDTSSDSGSDKREVVFAAANNFEFKAGIKLDNVNSRISGLRGRFNGTRGRYLRAVKESKPTSLAVDATIRHAVLHQPANSEFKVRSEDLHGKVRLEQKATLVILVVDASGSMAALRRMEAVKGATLALLEDAYRMRDQICVIAFRGAEAELLLPPTRSLQLANQAMQNLPTGGRTPLAHGLNMALQAAVACRKKAQLEPLLVVLTDGKGNVSLPNQDDPESSTRFVAGEICRQKFSAIVIDTEDGYLKIALAHKLATAMGAEYLGLDRLSAETLALTIRGRLHQVVR